MTNIEFPTKLLDQRTHWVTPQEKKFIIAKLKEDDVLWAIDYILAHAKDLREEWAYDKKDTYDPEIKARVWMLRRPVTRALFQRLIELEAIEQISREIQEGK